MLTRINRPHHHTAHYRNRASCLCFPPPPNFGRSGAGLNDAGEEVSRGFIIGVLGYEVACEGFGLNALVEVAQQFQGLCGLGFEAVDLREGGFDTAERNSAFICTWKR